ncbi:MAG: hypothetical protein E6L03_00925 [Thaumarchaeota archaeon]|nr:MAG: hypothetical protein E6L03_00925 [Nitrososphaerota archaeon]
MTIPGLAELTDGEENISPTLFLLSGPPGIGKRDFLRRVSILEKNAFFFRRKLQIEKESNYLALMRKKSIRYL